MPRFLLQLVAGWVLLAGSGLAARAAADWPPIDPAEFELRQSPIDPEAGAEILHREVKIDGSDYSRTYVTNYLRIRVYSERGVEKLSKIELPHTRRTSLRNIEARTIRPDGTILELDEDDVYAREAYKSDDARVKVMAFAPPGLAPGVILEYRYQQVSYFGAGRFILGFQGNLPARRVVYRVRTFDQSPLAVQAVFFNCPNQDLERGRDRYFTFELTNLAAVEDEPLPPPKMQRQATAFVYYTYAHTARMSVEDKWRQDARDLHERLEKEGRITREIREAAAALVQPGDNPDEKLRKLFAHCRTRIQNRDYPPPGLPDEPDKSNRRNHHATHTLERASGSSDDITILFASLARAAGLDARLARCNDREQMFFSPATHVPFSLTELVAAVRVGEQWRFFAPGDPYLPVGMLNWNNSATKALVGDRDQALFIDVPANDASASARSRTAAFKLDEEGNLEGDVTITCTGHAAADLRAQFAPEPVERHERLVREELQGRMKLAEVTKVVATHLTDPEQPMILAYHLRVPGYAERTGSRLFLQPAVLQKGATPFFTAAKRETDVVFRYRSTESDDVTVEPPAGYEIEAGSRPTDLDLGVLGKYSVSLGVTRRGGAIKYGRALRLTGLLVRQPQYDLLKAAFEEIHERDNHVLTLRRSDAGAPTSDTPADPSGTASQPSPAGPAEG